MHLIVTYLLQMPVKVQICGENRSVGMSVAREKKDLFMWLVLYNVSIKGFDVHPLMRLITPIVFT